MTISIEALFKHMSKQRRRIKELEEINADTMKAVLSDAKKIKAQKQTIAFQEQQLVSLRHQKEDLEHYKELWNDVIKN